MTVEIVWAGGGSQEFLDDDARKYAYSVTDAGVLRVLSTDGQGLWVVASEHSPRAWVDVAGTRYHHSTENLAGRDGMAHQQVSPRRIGEAR